MPKDVMIVDTSVAQMLLRKLGKKYVTRSDVQAMTMDEDFELHAPNGVIPGKAGDVVVHDFANDKYAVYPPDAFSSQFKTPRTRKPKATEPGRPSLLPTGSGAPPPPPPSTPSNN